MTDWRDRTVPTAPGEWCLTTHHPLAEREIEIDIFAEDRSKAPDTFTDAALDRLLSLGPDRIPEIRALLYPHAQVCCRVTDFGFDVPDGTDVQDANMRAFGILSEADAFQPDWIDGGLINTAGAYTRALLSLYPPWEDEHGAHVLIATDGTLSLDD